MSSEIADRYARALFRAADNAGQQEEDATSLEALAPLLQKSSPFLHWMLSPQIPRKKKIEMLEKHLGGACSRRVSDFLLLLIDKGRFQELPGIVENYRRRFREKSGLIDVRLITTVPIDDSAKEKLASKLQGMFGLKPQIRQEIDPAIIGGSVIAIGNKIIDNSVRGKLSRLKNHLLRGSR